MSVRNKFLIILGVIFAISLSYYLFSTPRSKDMVLIGTVDSNQVVVSPQMQGRIVKLKGTPSDPGQVSGQSPDLLPYSFNFQAPPDAHELTLVLAVSQSRFLEFVAKPEQVREDGSVPQN